MTFFFFVTIFAMLQNATLNNIDETMFNKHFLVFMETAITLVFYSVSLIIIPFKRLNTAFEMTLLL